MSVVIGVINSIYSSRRAERQRQTEIETRKRRFLMQFIDRTNDPEFWDTFNEVMYNQEWTDPEDFQRRFGPDNPKAYAARASLMNFYNSLGYIIESESVDIDFLHYGFQVHVLRLWEKFQPWLEYQRERSRDPLQFDQLEILYNKIKKIRG